MVTVELFRSGKQVVTVDGFLPGIERILSRSEYQNGPPESNSNRDDLFLDLVNSNLINEFDKTKYNSGSEISCDLFILRLNQRIKFPFNYIPLQYEYLLPEKNVNEYRVVSAITSEGGSGLVKHVLPSILKEIGLREKTIEEHKNFSLYKHFIESLSLEMISMYVNPGEKFGMLIDVFGGIKNQYRAIL